MRIASRILVLIFLLGFSAAALAEKPVWVSNGTESLEKARTNNSYTFRKFESFNSDIDQLRRDRFNPLVGYLARAYGLDSVSATVTRISAGTPVPSVPDDAEGEMRVQAEYKVTFSAPRQATFYAKLADEYISLDENADMSYDYTLNQLYALSVDDSGSMPVFDDFELTRKYNGKALALSIVPGLGQMYKGQKVKGWVILGGEAGLVAMAVYFNHRARNYAHDFDKADAAIAPSYRSKKKSWQNIRNVAIAGACGLYVYNLLDAAISKGARRVTVSKSSGSQLALGPGFVYDPASVAAPAVSLTLTF